MSRSPDLSISSVCVATIILVANPADAQDAETPNAIFRGYGQFHFAYQSFDDGTSVTSNIVDISNANSRAGFFLEDGGPWQLHFETGLGFRPSSGTSQQVTPDFWDWKISDLRILQVAYTSEFGEFVIGQGKMPTDGAAEADLGKTVVVAKSTIPEGYGAYEFRDDSGALSGISIKDTFNNFDGARRGRIQYTTPEFAGFEISAAFGKEILSSDDDKDYFDIALNYAGASGALKYEGSVGWAVADDKGSRSRITVGSFSILHEPTGLNGSIAAGRGEEAETYIYGKVGWNTKLVSWGTTKLVAELFDGNDYVTSGSNSDMWGVGVIQDVDQINTEVYAGLRNFSFSDPGPTSYANATGLQIGARWRF